ncbi:MAG: MFS transporter, partial [Anaerolineales bacterium]|nr:MFS transporter [Anaerolineales bacterium]
MTAYKLYLLILGTRRLSYATGYTLFAIYLLRIVGTNPLELVLPGVVYELAIFLGEIPTGVVADAYSRRLSVIIGYFLMGIGFIIAGLLPLLWVAIIGLAIIGLGSTFVSGALSAWLVDEVGQEQAAQAFLRGSQVSIVASFVGIGLSMILGSINLQLAVMGAGVPLLAMAFIMLWVMPESGFQPAPAAERESWAALLTTFGRGWTFVRASRVILWIFIVTLVLAGFGETFGKLWQAHVLENFTLPTLANFDDILWFGLISGVSIPVSLLATELIRQRLDMTNSHTVVHTLMLLFISLSGSALLFALSNRFIMVLCGIWLVHIVMAMIGPLMTIWLNQQVESHIRATVLSIVGQVNSLGEIIIGGPIAGGIATL